MMPHEDEQEDKDMIKSILQKIISDMDGLESDRISKKPTVVTGHLNVAHPEPENMATGGYAKGGFLGDLKKGALHKDLGVPSDKPIPSGKLDKALHSDNETLRKRAQFAENAKHFKHADGGEIQNDDNLTGDSQNSSEAELAAFQRGMQQNPQPSLDDYAKLQAAMQKQMAPSDADLVAMRKGQLMANEKTRLAKLQNNKAQGGEITPSEQDLKVDRNGVGKLMPPTMPDDESREPRTSSKMYEGHEDIATDHAGEGHMPDCSYPDHSMAYGGEMHQHPHNHPNDNTGYEPGDKDGNSQEESDLDPSTLKKLMDQAAQADDEGVLPEDREDELPEDIKKAVRAKRSKGMPK